MSAPQAAPRAAAAGLALVTRLGRALDHPAAPWVAAAAAGGLIWWLLGSLTPLPWVYDESAYLLQAEIFASGRWAAPGRPLPEFFEQFHVFVTPRLVPKYPPGHALLLVPGVWIGAPGLVPVLATAITAGLLFGWVRRITGGWVAAVALAVWLTAPAELYIRPSYMSQVTSTLVWLLAWLALARWRDRGSYAALAGFAGLAALAALIRPITAAALLLPAGVWILGRVWQARRGARVATQVAVGQAAFGPGAGRRTAGVGRQLALAALVAMPVLAIAPVWSYATSGRVFPTPYSEYSRVYAPWNMPGFRVDDRPPQRELPPALRKFRDEWLPVHRAHRLERLPAIAAERLRGLAVTFFGGGPLRWVLLAAFAVGLARPGRELGFGLWCAAALVAAHLWMPARPLWTVYYLEVFPVLAAVTGLGAWRIAGAAAAAVRRVAGAGASSPLHAAALVTAGLLIAVPGTVERLLRAKDQQETLRLVQTELAAAVDGIPGRAIVFVSSGPAHRPYESYVRNVPDLDEARVWVVQDRGADNGRLAALAPDRALFRFDPGTGALEPWRADP